MARNEYTTALDGNIRKDLEHLKAELQIMQSGIVVVISSLREQQADLDPDIICVLEHHVSNRLFKQMDRLEELIGSLHPHAIAFTEAGSVQYERVPMQ